MPFESLLRWHRLLLVECLLKNIYTFLKEFIVNAFLIKFILVEEWTNKNNIDLPDIPISCNFD